MAKRLNFILIVLLFFVMNFAVVNGEIFRDALFLSTYPNTWLSYLFLATFLFNLCMFMAVSSFLRKGLKSAPHIILISTIVVGFLGAWALNLNFYWFPFVYAVYLSFLYPIFIFLLFNLSSGAFHIRDYKKYAPKFRAGASLGIVLGAFLTPFLIHWFGVNSSLYLALFGLCVMEFILYLIPDRPVEAFDKNKQERFKGSLKDYPSLKVLLPLMLFMSVGYYLATYLLKNELNLVFDRQQIAVFLGYLVGIIYSISFLIQTFVSQAAIHRFGVISLLYVAPTVVLLGMIFSVFYVSVISLAIYLLLVSVSLFCFHILASEMALSPLPLPIRLWAKMLEEGILVPLGQGVVAILFIGLTLLVANVELRMILAALFTVAYCIPWLAMVKKGQKLYQDSLAEALEMRGFSFGGEYVNNLDAEKRGEIAKDILKRPSPKFYPVAFSIIETLSPVSEDLLALLFKKVQDPDEWVQLESIRVFMKRAKELPHLPLLEQLKVEKNAEVTWRLVNFFAKEEGDEVIRLAEDSLTKVPTFKQVYMTHILLASQEAQKIEKGLALLKEAFKHKDPAIRLAALRVWGENSLDEQGDFLGPLMTDSDPKVVTEALHFAAKRHLTKWAPVMADKLEVKGLLHEAAQALSVFGPEMIPYLQKKIETVKKWSVIHAAIKLICSFEGAEAEKAILSLAESPNEMIRSTTAFFALNFDQKVWRSGAYKAQVYRLIFEEASKRAELICMDKESHTSYVEKEIKVKTCQAGIRLISWFGCYSNPESVFKLLPFIRSIELNKEDSSVRVHTALEWLNSLASDRKLKYIFSTWHYEKQPDEVSVPYKGDDRYLRELIAYNARQKGGSMDDTMDKLVVLREITLFEKLPADVLFVVAEEARWKEMAKGEILFSEGDAPDGLYIVASGLVAIKSKGNTLSLLGENSFFGEIGLINGAPRMGDAICEEEGSLLFLDQTTFNDLTYEFPEVLRSVACTIISYLHKKN